MFKRNKKYLETHHKDYMDHKRRDMTPEELVCNTWYVVYYKETKKVVGEIVFTSYDKVNDSITISHAIPLALRKVCLQSVLQEGSKYEYRRVSDLTYPKGHIHASSPYYLRSWDAL